MSPRSAHIMKRQNSRDNVSKHFPLSDELCPLEATVFAVRPWFQLNEVVKVGASLTPSRLGSQEDSPGRSRTLPAHSRKAGLHPTDSSHLRLSSPELRGNSSVPPAAPSTARCYGNRNSPIHSQSRKPRPPWTGRAPNFPAVTAEAGRR